MDHARLRSFLAGPAWIYLANGFLVGLGAALVTSAIVNVLVPDALYGRWLYLPLIPLAALVSLAGYGLVSNWFFLSPPVAVILDAGACNMGPGAYCVPPTVGELLGLSFLFAILLGTTGHLLGKVVEWWDVDLPTAAS